VYLQEFRSHTLKPTLVVVQSLSLITVTETDDDEQHQGRAAQRTGPSSKAPSLAPCCSFLPRNFAIFQFKRVSSSPQCCTGDGTARPPPPAAIGISPFFLLSSAGDRSEACTAPPWGNGHQDLTRRENGFCQLNSCRIALLSARNWWWPKMLVRFALTVTGDCGKRSWSRTEGRHRHHFTSIYFLRL
jgi:hypothetical protein